MMVRVCRVCGRKQELDINSALLAQAYAAIPYVCDECLDGMEEGRKVERKVWMKARREAAERS